MQNITRPVTIIQALPPETNSSVEKELRNKQRLSTHKLRLRFTLHPWSAEKLREYANILSTHKSTSKLKYWTITGWKEKLLMILQ